ncbi:MAG: TrmB family transcriptional regulator [Nitrosopumilaceae archaeon]|nr:TrmB family transcriptional regulator [Nitrosopumilaceae archaeon]NIU01165.1 TrmB family transcriptional regulator [Nitrosopumilaceae archaeon]NIU87534.1 TrmB family transcriptional regulator [Nitrosopumilaceae archaeon]NIV65999.1 TrmB family transcriptional regulator [Nitrosopumilaceae archaeon]NIX61767.1 TrmB family transcriptional regulator [Nitrosopumilaceae archaeon]
MMSFQDHVNWLTTELAEILDLDDLEAKIYLNLLRTGPITASALAKELDLDRARMYRTVDKLVNMNIVSTTLSSPKLCIPVKPQEALKISLRKKEDEIKKIKKIGEEVVDRINDEISSNQTTNFPTFRVVQGKSNIFADIAQLIENSSDTVYIATTLQDVSRMYHSAIPEKIIACEKKGGKVRLLVELDDPKLAHFVKRFSATETKISKLPSKGRIVVQKTKQMIMSDSSLTNQKTTNTDSDFSLCTNSSEMIDNIYTLCEVLWDNAQPLSALDVKNFVRKNH